MEAEYTSIRLAELVINESVSRFDVATPLLPLFMQSLMAEGVNRYQVLSNFFEIKRIFDEILFLVYSKIIQRIASEYRIKEEVTLNAEDGLNLVMDAARGREKYDDGAKKLFGRKEILSPILQHVVSEYAGYTAEEIMQFIEGDTIRTGTAAVSPDMANTISGQNGQSVVLGEATSLFDVFFGQCS